MNPLDPAVAMLRCWEHEDCLEHPELALECERDAFQMRIPDMESERWGMWFTEGAWRFDGSANGIGGGYCAPMGQVRRERGGKQNADGTGDGDTAYRLHRGEGEGNGSGGGSSDGYGGALQELR